MIHINSTMFRIFAKNVNARTLKGRTFCSSGRRLGVHADLSVRDGIGIIRLVSPGKVNVLNTEVLADMKTITDEIETNPNIKGSILISNKPDCFIAGADIKMLTACTTAKEVEDLSREGHVMLSKVEKSKKPVVAAIMGSCLGGGIEVALACHYRIAVNHKTTISFPEVLLGLLPAGGGTVRTPKLIGLPNTLDLMLTGKNVRAEKAKALGLVDQLIQPLGPGVSSTEQAMLEYLENAAIQTVKDLVSGKLKINRSPKGMNEKLMNMAIKNSYVKDYIFKQAKSKVMKQTLGLYPAPLTIMNVIRAGLDKGEAGGLSEEAKAFGELAMTKESKGLISLFHGQTECKKNKLGKPKRETKNLAVLGAGLMGAGIAQVSIDKGYKTVLKDTNMAGLMKGEVQVDKGVKLNVKKKKYSSFEGEKILSNLTPTLDYEKLANADMVIEAVLEEISVKQKVLREVEAIVPEHCIFATNTSALSVEKIAEASKRPEQVVGLHYFSPVDKMMLLEIVKTKQTSQETLKAVVELALKQGKTPIIVNDGPGFYTTRLIMTFITEVFRLLVEGVDPFKLDKLSMEFGFPIGCVTLSDDVGIDIGFHIYLYFLEVFGDRIRAVDPAAGFELVKAGYIGRKAGKGTFLYEDGKKTKRLNEGAMELVKKYYQEPKIPHTDENIQLRMVSRFINEAFYCLQENIISNPLEGDIGAVFGLGFPPFTGGPFHFVDSYGADKLVGKMREYEQQYGATFTPSQLLLDYAKDPSKKFFS